MKTTSFLWNCARILNGLLTTLHLSIELPAKATHKRDTGFLSHSMPWEEQQQSARACHHFYFMWASEVGKRYDEIYNDALCAATSWWGVITRRRPRDPDMRIWVASAATAPAKNGKSSFHGRLSNSHFIRLRFGGDQWRDRGRVRGYHPASRMVYGRLGGYGAHVAMKLP